MAPNQFIEERLETMLWRPVPDEVLLVEEQQRGTSRFILFRLKIFC